MSKLKPETEIVMLKYLTDLGYDIQILKKQTNVYKVVVWQGNKELGEGKFEYNCWHKALSKTIEDLYIKIKSITNRAHN